MARRSGAGAAGWLAGSALGIILLPLLFLISIAARMKPKAVDVGIGPQPLVSHGYHKQALTRLGYSAETFVCKTYFISGDFDIDIERRFGLKALPRPLNRSIAALLAFVLVIWRYRLVYIYFNGGPLGMLPGFLKRCEAFFFRLAGVRILVMPYGSDVQDMRLSPNLYFKHTLAQSYPGLRYAGQRVARDIDYWTRNADHVLSGVEWVDYMSYWDTLTLGHFSIDCAALRPAADTVPPLSGKRPLRVLHAPNHRHVKGTDPLLAAVENLQRQGRAIELVLVEKRSNREVLEEIARADLVVDQLVIGWYAMFAIEAMALGKPVVCHIRPDLEELYRKAGLIEAGELPFLKADTLSIGVLLEDVAKGVHDLDALGHKGRQFVERHHSLETIGAMFDRINRSIGVLPSRTAS